MVSTIKSLIQWEKCDPGHWPGHVATQDVLMDHADPSELIELVDLSVFGRLAVVTLSGFDDHRLHANRAGSQESEDIDHAHLAIDLSFVHANHHAFKRANATINLLSQQFVNRFVIIENFSLNVCNTK